ncbi:MAG: alcohol dehydrogenase catalytic domain-containing protein [Anaerolineae bacterium]|nr:alcohol dehydrogenase catalytic domain-containing protein [Anaerolineae bacterium]
MTIPSSMRVSKLYGIRDLRLETGPVPLPGPGEVLLKIASVGTCGSDVHYYVEGGIGDAIVTDPITMGHEFSAWIAGLGEGVEGLELGQLVAVEPAIPCGHCESCEHGHPNLCPNVRFCGTPPIDGVFAEYAVMPAENCFLLPEGFTPEQGALLEPLGIGIHTVDLAHLKVGQTVAVLGAGPVGLLIAAVAKAAGAGAIYMTEPIRERREFALSYCADAVFDPATEDVVQSIMDATGGRGIDVAFEAAGAEETPDQAARIARPGGKVVVVGIPSEDRMVMTASVIRRKGLTIKLVRRMKHTYPRAIRMVVTGLVNIDPLATHYFTLDTMQQAFEMVAHHSDGVLRAMINVGTGDKGAQ